MLEKVENDVPVVSKTDNGLWQFYSLDFIWKYLGVLWKFSLLSSTIMFIILSFWIIRTWEIYVRLIQWMDCLLEQAS